MAREGEKLCASKEADKHGDRQGFEEAKAEDHVDRQGSAQSHGQVYARTHLRPLGEGHEDGVVRDGHVSETELLIAHVLAAMKDCNLFGKEDKSSSSSSSSARMSKEASSQAFSEVWTSSAASQTKVATQTSSPQAHAAASTSSSPWVKGAAWTSSQAEMTTQTSPHVHMVTQTLSHACAAAGSLSQENKAALCIASLKHTHNKENYKPSTNGALDMQDERAKPKFRNVADLYKLSEY